MAMATGGGTWAKPAVKGPSPTSANKPGGTSGNSVPDTTKKAVSPSLGKDMAAALSARNK